MDVLDSKWETHVKNAGAKRTIAAALELKEEWEEDMFFFDVPVGVCKSKTKPGKAYFYADKTQVAKALYQHWTTGQSRYTIHECYGRGMGKGFKNKGDSRGFRVVCDWDGELGDEHKCSAEVRRLNTRALFQFAEILGKRVARYIRENAPSTLELFVASGINDVLVQILDSSLVVATEKDLYPSGPVEELAFRRAHIIVRGPALFERLAQVEHIVQAAIADYSSVATSHCKDTVSREMRALGELMLKIVESGVIDLGPCKEGKASLRMPCCVGKSRCPGDLGRVIVPRAIYSCGSDTWHTSPPDWEPKDWKVIMDMLVLPVVDMELEQQRRPVVMADPSAGAQIGQVPTGQLVQYHEWLTSPTSHAAMDTIVTEFLTAFAEQTPAWGKWFKHGNNDKSRLISCMYCELRPDAQGLRHTLFGTRIILDTTCSWCCRKAQHHYGDARNVPLVIDLTTNPFSVYTRCFSTVCAQKQVARRKIGLNTVTSWHNVQRAIEFLISH